MAITQDNLPIQVQTPVDGFVLYRLTAHEQLGQLFEIHVDLLSEMETCDFGAMLGNSMGVEIPWKDSESDPRYLHGFINRFEHIGIHQGMTRYRATMVPWLWFLSRTTDCRIFQEMSVVQIVTQLFDEYSVNDYKLELSESYEVREYCVQYRETDLNFVCRLLEEVGIYFYFTHTSTAHTLVLTDDSSRHAATDGYSQVPFFPPGNPSARERDHVSDWRVKQQVSTGKYVLDDYDFLNPSGDLMQKSAVSRSHNLSDAEFYDYPGSFENLTAGRTVVKRIEELQAHHQRSQGSGNARGLACGALFTLEEHPVDDFNAEYLIVSTTYEIQNNEFVAGEVGTGSSGLCSFEVMPSGEQFRSPRTTPKPVIQGPQTAIVVGRADDEIFTDEHGRIKVQFHWDRLGTNDENSSCWIRVAQTWAGNKWGSIHIPRVGQEVMVEFLEGDPDRPIITGRVYNAEQMPPYELPANQTQSGIKSRSTAGATDQNYNELRFEDKFENELIYFHAEKDFERVVENNDTLKVGFDKKDAGDQVIEIFNNRQLTVGNKDSKDGSQTISVYKDHTETLETGDATYTISKGKRTTTIQGDDALTLKTGDQSIEIKSGKNTTEAAQSILLKVGGSSIKIEPAAITLKSVQINIQGDASLDLKAPMTSCEGSGMLTLKGGLTQIN